MLLLKLLQKLFQTLNSDGTPGQVAFGMALGAVFGLTPLVNLHNLVLFAVAMVVNCSLAGVFLGWTLAAPVGFLLDPLFDVVGRRLLEAPGLASLWTALYNMPGVPLTHFNNTVVLGSVVCWAVSAVPLYFLWKRLVTKYRATIYERLRRTRAFKAVNASKLAAIYSVFRPAA